MHSIKFPQYIQPKINGARIMVENNSSGIILHSSKNKTYNDIIPHIKEAISDIFEVGIHPDGEIYKHGWPLSRITSRVKKHYKDTKKFSRFGLVSAIAYGIASVFMKIGVEMTNQFFFAFVYILFTSLILGLLILTKEEM